MDCTIKTSGFDKPAMENGPFIDGLPIKNGDFPWRTVSHKQRVPTEWGVDSLSFFDSSFQFETTALCVTLLGLVGHMTSTPQGVILIGWSPITVVLSRNHPQIYDTSEL